MKNQKLQYQLLSRKGSLKVPLNTFIHVATCMGEAVTYSFDYFNYKHSNKKKKHFYITKDIFDLGKNKFIRILSQHSN